MKDCNINFNNACLPNLQLRRLLQSDISVVQKLFDKWFPIKYPKNWYLDITSSPRFHATAAILDNNKVIGILVAEIKNQLDCNAEDRNLLSRRFDKSAKVAYILTLGVLSEYRRQGVASYLLNYLINQLTIESFEKDVKVLYLHTLVNNYVAINFYEKFNFTRHLYLPLYYYIDYEEKDGYSYVRYINGGYGPLFLIDHFHPLINFLNLNLRGILFNLKKNFKFVQRTILHILRNVSNANQSTDHDQLLFC